MENFKSKLRKITTIIFDVDGVLTDGKVFFLAGQGPVRNMYTKDAFALQAAVKKGYRIAVITGGSSEIIREGLSGLGIQDIFMKQSDKLSCYKEYIYSNNLSDEEIMFVGDDLPDWEVMKRVGIAACPKDSAHEIKEISIYISDKKGGEGCARDVIEQVMRVRGDWEITGW
jgi:3-deoxy-D-manno-octulosonate 8-phosphate phosphatase (KDO 8-P phosphatase)